MWLLPWRKRDKVIKLKEADVVYVCREVRQVGYKLEGSLSRLDNLITMINDRDRKPPVSSTPTSVTEV